METVLGISLSREQNGDLLRENGRASQPCLGLISYGVGAVGQMMVLMSFNFAVKRLWKGLHPDSKTLGQDQNSIAFPCQAVARTL